MTSKSKQQWTCIFVLGMHRSGTSALTGVLDILGVELGNELMQPWDDNPKGFFENERIWKFNQSILETFGSSWEDPFLYGESWCSSRELSGFENTIGEILETEFSAANVFAIKDPRMCILFPLWRKVCEDKGIRIVCLLPFRHPNEVAGSLTKRNGFSSQRGQILWLNHVFTAERISRGYVRAFLPYTELFGDCVKVLEQLSQQLNVSFPLPLEDVRDRLESFLDRDLQHHSAAGFGDTQIEQLLASVYKLLNTAVSGSDDSEWRYKFDSLCEGYEKLYAFFYEPDLQKAFGCLRRLEMLEIEYKNVATAKQAVEREKDSLARELSEIQVEKERLQQQIAALRSTKVWRFAEKLRRLTGWGQSG